MSVTIELKNNEVMCRTCDLDFQGSDPNVVRDTSSQYGDHFCEIVLKFNFK